MNSKYDSVDLSLMDLVKLLHGMCLFDLVHADVVYVSLQGVVSQCSKIQVLHQFLACLVSSLVTAVITVRQLHITV